MLDKNKTYRPISRSGLIELVIDELEIDLEKGEEGREYIRSFLNRIPNPDMMMYLNTYANEFQIVEHHTIFKEVAP